MTVSVTTCGKQGSCHRTSRTAVRLTCQAKQSWGLWQSVTQGCRAQLSSDYTCISTLGPTLSHLVEGKGSPRGVGVLRAQSQPHTAVRILCEAKQSWGLWQSVTQGCYSRAQLSSDYTCISTLGLSLSHSVGGKGSAGRSAMVSNYTSRSGGLTTP